MARSWPPARPIALSVCAMWRAVSRCRRSRQVRAQSKRFCSPPVAVCRSAAQTMAPCACGVCGGDRVAWAVGLTSPQTFGGCQNQPMRTDGAMLKGLDRAKRRGFQDTPAAVRCTCTVARARARSPSRRPPDLDRAGPEGLYAGAAGTALAHPFAQPAKHSSFASRLPAGQLCCV